MHLEWETRFARKLKKEKSLYVVLSISFIVDFMRVLWRRRSNQSRKILIAKLIMYVNSIFATNVFPDPRKKD